MLRPWVAILLLLALLSGADAARRKKKKGKTKGKPVAEKVEKAKVKEAKPTEAESKQDDITKAENAPGGGSSEMDAYRAIQKRSESTIQDLADLLLMYRSEYAKYDSAGARLKRAQELKLVRKNDAGENKLTRGALAYALMSVYQPEQGFLFWLTGWDRYALRDAQEAGLMPANATPGQKISGEQLFAIMTDAENFATQRGEWQKK